MEDFFKLSERQRNILRFMDRYIHENSFPPTIREIGAATDIDSTSVVNYNLNKLVQAGFLQRAESKSRGLKLIREVPNGFGSHRVKASDDIAVVKYWGQIVAGKPINAASDRDSERDVEIPASMLSGIDPSEVYALTVKGNSMIDAMIQDGDVVILRRTTTARDGEMVAVWLTDNEETTLKHFYNEGKRIRLQPAHPTMDAIYVEPKHCQVQGKVLSVLRRLG